MKLPIIALWFLALNICFLIKANAQNPDFIDPKGLDFNVDIPPLSQLLDSAFANNALVKYRNVDAAVMKGNLKTDRTYWLRNIGLQTDVRYGTFDHYTTTSSSEGYQPVNVAGSSNEFRFSVGAYMRLPLVDAINRKNQIRIGQLELEKATNMAESQRDILRQEVIRQYNELLLRIRLFKIKAKQLETARINQQMAEKEFINGVIPVSEYARLSDITVGVESNYEIARTDLNTALMILEDMTGIKFKINQTQPASNENN